MIRNEVEHIVRQSVQSHAKNNTISKSELEEILIEVLAQFGDSRALSDAVERRLEDKQKLSRMLKGIR